MTDRASDAMWSKQAVVINPGSFAGRHGSSGGPISVRIQTTFLAASLNISRSASARRITRLAAGFTVSCSTTRSPASSSKRQFLLPCLLRHANSLGSRSTPAIREFKRTLGVF